jgi:hypothetical protein
LMLVAFPYAEVGALISTSDGLSPILIIVA